jgi:hypothetical protein
LIRYAAEHLGSPATEKDRLTGAVLSDLLSKIVQPDPRLRRLTDTDLRQILTTATHVTLQRRDFDALVRATAVRVGEDRSPSRLELTTLPSILESESELPLPPILAERPSLIADIAGKARGSGLAIVTGSTGSGKTILARTTAKAEGATWYILDVRDAKADEINQRVALALGSLGTRLGGIILDDFNELEDPAARQALLRFIRALRRRDALCIITAYREPSSRALSELGVDRSAHLSVPDLTEDEVGAIVALAGGDASKWAKTVHQAGAFGHPQLVQAVISGLRARAWPDDELGRLQSFERSADVEAERRAARNRLVAAVPSEASSLLYRISILLGRFDRSLVLAVGGLEPIVNHPGAQLDLLIGPWVEQARQEQLRMSPLLQNAGREVLSPDAQRMVHRAAAEHIVANNRIAVDRTDAALLHALQGKSESTLVTLGYAVLRTNESDRRLVSDWSTALRLHRFDRLIYPDRLSISILLRLAQFLLVVTQGRATSIVKCWQTLQNELKLETDTSVREQFEYMMLALTLARREAAGILPNWVDLLVRFAQLAKEDAPRMQVLESVDRQIDGRPMFAQVGRRARIARMHANALKQRVGNDLGLLCSLAVRGFVAERVQRGGVRRVSRAAERE